MEVGHGTAEPAEEHNYALDGFAESAAGIPEMLNGMVNYVMRSVIRIPDLLEFQTPNLDLLYSTLGIGELDGKQPAEPSNLTVIGTDILRCKNWLESIDNLWPVPEFYKVSFAETDKDAIDSGQTQYSKVIRSKIEPAIERGDGKYVVRLPKKESFNKMVTDIRECVARHQSAGKKYRNPVLLYGLYAIFAIALIAAIKFRLPWLMMLCLCIAAIIIYIRASRHNLDSSSLSNLDLDDIWVSALDSVVESPYLACTKSVQDHIAQPILNAILSLKKLVPERVHEKIHMPSDKPSGDCQEAKLLDYMKDKSCVGKDITIKMLAEHKKINNDAFEVKFDRAAFLEDIDECYANMNAVLSDYTKHTERIVPQRLLNALTDTHSLAKYIILHYFRREQTKAITDSIELCINDTLSDAVRKNESLVKSLMSMTPEEARSALIKELQTHPEDYGKLSASAQTACVNGLVRTLKPGSDADVKAALTPSPASLPKPTPTPAPPKPEQIKKKEEEDEEEEEADEEAEADEEGEEEEE